MPNNITEETDSFLCQRCQRDTTEDDCRTVVTRLGDRVSWCPRCIDVATSVCCDCGLTYDTYYTRCHEYNGDYLCQHCFLDSYQRCVSCDEVFLSVDCSPAGRCASCEEEAEDDDNCYGIHSYSYKPGPVFFPRHSPERYYGVELEVNVPGSRLGAIAEEILDGREDRLYLKEDASIGIGFEIVTHPHTLTEHRKLWTDICGNLPEGVTSYSSGKCGLHIHIERKKLTPLTIGKMLVVLNCQENMEFVTAIAQRNSEGYARIKPQKKVLDAVRFPESRFEALNLMNSATVELRIFRGNTRYERIMKALEFTDALVVFCNQASMQALSYKAFAKWVREHRSEYKFLDDYLVQTHYLPVVKSTGKKGEDN